MPTVADDSGLEIDFLNGEPGVRSRRWPGYEASDQGLIDMALAGLKGVPWEFRTARFRIVLTFCGFGQVIAEAAFTDGYIMESQEAACETGFPFRAIFWVAQFGKLYQELTPEEHDIINHRKRACEELKQKILKLAK